MTYKVLFVLSHSDNTERMHIQIDPTLRERCTEQKHKGKISKKNQQKAACCSGRRIEHKQARVIRAQKETEGQERV